MITLTRQGLLLSLSATVIPSQGSSDVPVAVVNDINTYVGYTLEPRVGYYLNGIYKSTVCTYDTSAKTFSVPAEAFRQIGIIDITLALIDNTNANHIETCQAVHATVNKAPLGTVVLPDQTTWQEYVRSYTQGFLNDYTTTTIDPLVTQAQQAITTANQASQTANEASQNVQTAYNNLGNYKVENGVIYFMKSDGTYNDQGITLAGQSTILDGQNNPILNGLMTPQDNLLINSDFRHGAINQKGQSSYNTQYQYGIDMWYMISTGTLTVNDDSISTSADLKQFFDRQPEDGDYTVAISVDGTLYTYTFEGFTGTSKTHNFNIGSNTLGVEMITKQIILYMNGDTFNIDFVKLEKGKHFTGMPVWNYPTEFLKCAHRYINFYGQSIRRTAFIGNAMAYITYELPTIMAENIECVIREDTTMLWQNDDTQSQVRTPITSATVIAKQGNAVTVQFNGSFGNENWRVAYCSGVGIELDAYDY